MTKRSDEAKRLAALPPKPAPIKRDLTPEETLEFQEILRIANGRTFEAAQVKGNTALIPRGQEVAAELDAIARLMVNAKNLWLSQKLLECGYADGTKCSINLSTGKITPNDEPTDNPAA